MTGGDQLQHEIQLSHNETLGNVHLLSPMHTDVLRFWWMRTALATGEHTLHLLDALARDALMGTNCSVNSTYNINVAMIHLLVLSQIYLWIIQRHVVKWKSK